MGTTCQTDAQCGPSGRCLTADGTELYGQGPAHGYCSRDCTAYLEALTAADPSAPPPVDPCDPGDGSAACLNLASSDTNPLVGRCMQLCTFGTPEFFGPDGKLASDKCHGRDEVACRLFVQEETGPDGKPVPVAVSGNVGWCKPQCAASDQCPKGYVCDLGVGACKLPEKKCQPGWTACDPTLVDGAGVAVRQCEGICLSLFGAEAPVEKQKLGVCLDPCEVNSPSACDGNGVNGFCGFYNLFSGVPNASSTDYVPYGNQDLAVCGVFLSSLTNDNKCPWEVGAFARTFGSGSNKIALCTLSSECTTADDCVLDCKTSSDCPAGDTCPAGTCLKAGQPDSGGASCVAVPETGRSYCLDHKPGALTPHVNLGCQ